MPIRVAINGFGRIGRCILRALYERPLDNIQIVAINDLTDLKTNAHLIQYDSTHGRFCGDISIDGDDLLVNGDRIHVFAESELSKLPWKEQKIDIVLECTGLFTARAQAAIHLQAGAKKVLISAPGSDADATIVYGVNHQTLQSSDTIVSNASCTTNCLVPLLAPLQKTIGIKSGLLTTMHAYTHDQVLVDSYHSDLRRARAAGHSIIPTKTGAAKSVELVLPELEGKLDGYAVRVPTLNVSLVDLTFVPTRPTSHAEIDEILKQASEGDLKGILAYCDEPLVSIDYNHSNYSSNYDSTQTRVIDDGALVKVLAWYDNEWAFSCRMLDTATAMFDA